MNTSGVKHSDELSIAAAKNVKEKEYWLEKLSGQLSRSGFPYDYKPGTKIPADEAGPVEKCIEAFAFNDDLLALLNKLGKGVDHMLHMLLTAGWAALLAKYTGNDDIILGTTIYKQEQDADFINTILPLRCSIDGEMAFKELILQVRQTIIEANENQNYPFEILCQEIQEPLSQTGDSFLATALLLENIHNVDYLHPLQPDLLCLFRREETGIEGRVLYNPTLYNASSVQSFIYHYKRLLTTALSNPAIQLKDIDLLNEKEKEQLLFEFNDTAAAYPEDQTIHRLFANQVARTPGNEAVKGLSVFTGRPLSLTYGQLEQKALHLAARLNEAGVGPDTIVGLQMERAVETVVGILGILFAGGAYLPIDPEYPAERIDFMIHDSGIQYLVTSGQEIKENTFKGRIIAMEEGEQSQRLPSEIPGPQAQPGNLAYVIYTSGTTGKPKGVLLEHKNVVRLLFNDRFQFDFSEKDVWTLFHSFSFDFSVWEMYGALLYGGLLVVTSRMTARDPELFLELVKKEKVTVLNQTPSAFDNFVRQELKSTEIKDKGLRLRYVIFGGEALKPAKLKEWYQKYPETKLVNMFGITETCVHVTYKEIGPREIEAGISNIGKPIPTLSTYILNQHLQLMPPGAPGELAVGGLGVARGYLNRPALTSEKFVSWDSGKDDGGRLYRSGDLARHLPGGEMEYLGRIDHQVQVRGFRIELGEIESRLLLHPHIAEAVVIDRTDGDGATYLCAYVVLISVDEGQIALNAPELREFLGNYLPDYMIPNYFVPMEAIPLTPNGKVDRKKLPQPSTALEGRYVAPRNSDEESLAQLWQEVLQLDRVGIEDNFFNLGGDSIKAIRLVSAVNNRFDSHLNVVDLYTHDTINKLAAHVTITGTETARLLYRETEARVEALKKELLEQFPENERDNIEDIYPMSDIEKGMVFYYLKDGGTGVYHDQFVYPMRYKNFDIQRLYSAWKLLVAKHEILRTAFYLEGFGQPIQVVLKAVPFDVAHEDISHLPQEAQQERIEELLAEDRRRLFDAAAAPLWRLRVFILGEHNICAIFICHHAILDGWSIASSMSELHNTYIELGENGDYAPAKLEASYKHMVIEELSAKENRETRDFWKNRLAGYQRLDFSQTVKNKGQMGQMEIYHYDSHPELLVKVRETAARLGTSMKTLCFSAYAYIMSLFSYEKEFVVGCVTNTRPAHSDGDKILGCFLNTVPVPVTIPTRITWEEHIAAVDEQMRHIKPHERLSLFEIALTIGERSKDQNPLFDTLFNFMDFHILNEARSERDNGSENTKHRQSSKAVQDGGPGGAAPLPAGRPLGEPPEANDEFIESGPPPLWSQGNQDTNTLFDFEVEITTGVVGLCPKYNTEAVSRDMVARFCVYFLNILDKYIHEPGAQIRTDDILSKEEKEELLITFNDTAAPYSDQKTMHQLFEEQVERTPENIAVIDTDGKRSKTYKEINEDANRLAHALREKGIKPNEFVAVVMDRSLEMVIAVMGILKSGGAYVPQEPYLPELRIQKILESLDVTCVMATPSTAEKVKTITAALPDAEHLFVLDHGLEAFSQYPAVNPSPAATSEDVAYVIFTSGSTGTPKGVVETHKPVVNILEWVNKTFDVGPDDKLMFITSLGFDLSVYDIFGILASGGNLRVVPAADIKDPMRLLDIIVSERITFWDSAPAALQQLVPFFSQLRETSFTNTLRLVFLSGDWIPVPMPDALRATFQGVRVISLGGATEATIWSNFYPIGEVDPTWPSIPYGRPIQNAKYYILDQRLNLLPVLIPGDLYIGGLCLATEYKNDPQLTASKFIPNPFVPGEKIYKTGDIARFFPDGIMEFLGRKDHQVKIRGFRIELGEIESQFSSHPAVGDCIILDRLDAGGTRYLCAYYVPQTPGLEPNKEVFKEHLARELPDYMIPTYFIAIDRIPLTPNGKLDRKALPEPEGSEEETVTPPENDTQRQLVDIWAETLGLEPGTVGIDSDFFELGGHSLNATIVIAKIHKVLKVKLPLAELFNAPTIREIAVFIGGGEEAVYEAIEGVEKREYYPLSSAQERLYILQQMMLTSTFYNMPQHIPMDGQCDVERLEKTFLKLIERHESLRTSFKLADDLPVQVIHDMEEISFNLEVQNRRSEPQLWEADFARFVRPFDLGQAPLLRVGVIKTGDDGFILMFDMHHIITDGASQDILSSEFTALYMGQELPPLRLQYKDYAAWQNSRKGDESLRRQGEYWVKEFSGELPVTAIPTDFPRPEMQGYEGNKASFLIGAEETKIIKALAANRDATLYMSLLAVFNIFFAKLSGRDDIVLGTPAAARGHADLRYIIGMMANTLPMRNFPTSEKEVGAFLTEVRERTLAAYENQEYQFDDLVEAVNVRRDTSRNPIFDIMLNLLSRVEAQDENNTIPEEAEVAESQMAVRHQKATSRFDMTWNVTDMGKVLHVDLEYSTHLFSSETIDNYISYLKQVIRCIPDDGSVRIADIEMITPEARTLVLGFSQGITDPTEEEKEKPLHRWFQHTAAQHADETALSFEGREILYGDLEKESNRLAHWLREQGVGADTVVGVMVERSPQMIIALLAVLKAGGAYLPIDPELPEERITEILADSGAPLVLVKGGKENVDTGQCRAALLEKLKETLANYPDTAPEELENSDDTGNLAYVIYTSGSTGKPKGVMLEHRNVLNVLRYQFNYTNIDFNRVLQFTTLSFDVSFQEIFSTLLSGGRLTLVTKETVNDVPALFRVVQEENIKTMFLPASFLKFVMNEADYVSLLPSTVEHIVTAGEQLIVNKPFRDYLQRNKVYLHNHYGPSETHAVTALTLSPEGDIPELPSIGKPFSNTGIHIVDPGNHLVPVGIPGELIISGIQVGRGYLNNPELTHDKFPKTISANSENKEFETPQNTSQATQSRAIGGPGGAAPWCPPHRRPRRAAGGTYYQTGDLACWLPDGNIEFLGRVDFQVKIRGFRVEPGEIESRLLDHDGVRDAVVLAREEEKGGRYLCAYVVLDGGTETPELREHLSHELPDYMVPSYFVALESIPLTANRKVDRAALPEPQMEAGDGYVAPKDAVEKALTEMWGRLLGMPQEAVSTGANFFDLGGHSLKATILKTRIHKAFNVEIPLGRIFKNPTVSALAALIRESESGQARFKAIEVVEARDYYELSSAQKRLFILHRMNPGGTAYNMPQVLPFSDRVDKEALTGAFQALIARHESLRTTFTMIGKLPVQRIVTDAHLEIQYFKLLGDQYATTAEVMEEFVQPFDLSKAPLLRVGLLEMENGFHYLLVDIHHIITDGMSNRILEEEFVALYNGDALPPLKLQYCDYALWQAARREDESLKRQEAFWLRQFPDANSVPVLKLATDFPRPANRRPKGRSFASQLDNSLTAPLKELARAEGATHFMVLAALAYTLLHKLTGQEDIVLGTPTAGRSHADLEPIIGMFVNTVALRSYPAATKTFRQLVAEVKENTLEVFENQDYQFDDLVDRVVPKIDASRNPVFDVMFSFENIEEASAEAAAPAPAESGEKVSEGDYHSKFDLQLRVKEAGGSFEIFFEYSTDLFKEETIKRYANYFREIASAVTQNNDTLLKDIAISHKFQQQKARKKKVAFKI